MNGFKHWVLGLGFASLVACAPNENVSLKALDVSTSEIGSTTYINMEAIVTVGNLKFPNIEVPVINPNNLHSLGQMALQRLDDGTNRLYLSIDYQEATQLSSSIGSTLPNGRELPVQANSGLNAPIGIPVMEHSRIYLGGDLQKELMMGVAITVPAFDSVLSQVPIPLNLFYGFPISNQISGLAGVFSGPSAGENGIAIFAKKIMVESHIAHQGPPQGVSIPCAIGDDLKHIDPFTLLKLDQLLKRNAVLRIR